LLRTTGVLVCGQSKVIYFKFFFEGGYAMRNLRVLIVVLAIVGISSVASAIEFMEDFESYAPGSEMHGQGGWKGWDNSLSAGAPASDLYALSGSVSVEIAGVSDLVHEFDLAGGRWELSAMQYIPSGKTGEHWFILLNTYNDNGDKDWSVQVNFNMSTGVLRSDEGGGTANILYDQWVELKFIIDLDNNTVDAYYNGEMFTSHVWDDNNHGTLQCIDLWGNNASEVYYDDISIMAPPRAYNPTPADGAIHPDTWVSLSWSSGSFAVSHDVYLGDNFDDVNDGVGDTFRGNQPSTVFVAGFPGFPYPDGLVPGSTYYWRIDEVNDLNPNSPWKGDVWSFTVPPRTAYAPNPADGAKFIDPNADLSWAAGFGAKLHTVYFGDNFDDVNSATGGGTQGITTYSLEPLELEKTYYWRVDEFDVITTHKGDVWSFTTARAGGGVKGQYYRHSGVTPPNPASLAFRTLMLTRTDPQINFSWGNGSPDESINADDFSAKWTGEVEAAFTETYTFYTNTDDGVKLWINQH